MEGLRPTPSHPGQRILAAQQRHDKSIQKPTIQPLAPMLGMSAAYLTTTSGITKKKIVITCVTKGPIGKCLEVIIRRDAQVRPGTFAFRAM